MPRSEQNEAKSREVKLEPWSTSYLVRYSVFCKHFQHKINCSVKSNLSEFFYNDKP